MKRIFGLLILMMAVTGCQKAATSTRIGSAGLTPDAVSQATGISLNGIVVDSNGQSAFNERVRDVMELLLSRGDVGYVSAQGGSSGVYVGGRIELADGQPLRFGNTRAQINPSSQLLIGVVDEFANQSTIAPLPALFFSRANSAFMRATGEVSGNYVDMKFISDGDPSKNYAGKGFVRLTGQLEQTRSILSVDYQIDRTFDGHVGASRALGTLYIPTCQFFRCQ